MRHAVEAELPDELVARLVGLCRIESAVVELRCPHRELQFEVWEASLLHLSPKPFQGIACLLNTSDALDEGREFVNHEHGLAVYLVVVRLPEEKLNVAPAHLLEGFATHAAPPDDVALAKMGDARVPVVLYVMVCPHEVEPHLVGIAGFQEAVGKRCLHEGTLVEPIPIEDEDVHAVAGGLLNLHFHDSRVGLVDVSPQRTTVPVVSGIALLHGHHRLPFAHARWPEGPQTRIVGSIGGIEVSRNVVVPFRLSKAGNDRHHQAQKND